MANYPEPSAPEPKQNISTPTPTPEGKEKIDPTKSNSNSSQGIQTRTVIPKLSTIVLPVEQDEEPIDYGATVSTSQGFGDFSSEYVFRRKTSLKPLDVASGHSENKEVDPLNYKGYRVDLVGGLIPSLGVSSESGDLNPLPFYAGANFIFIPSLKLELGIGLQYEQLSFEGITKEIEQVSYSFGLNQTNYSISPQALSFVSMPVSASYLIFPKHRIQGGFLISRLVQVRSTETKTSSSSGVSGVIQESQEKNGYFDGFNETSVSATIGYEYNFLPRWRFNLQSRIGLTPIQEYQGVKNELLHLKIGVSYHIWKK